MMRQGFYAVNAADSVATALTDMEAGDGEVFGAVEGRIRALKPVERGFKIALKDMKKGEPVYKYGVCIGTASADILKGEPVHSHNLSSRYDLRSGGFDQKTAAPADISYEL